MGTSKQLNLAEIIAEVESTDDPRQAYASVKKAVSAYQAIGSPVPEDLKRYQRTLMTELTSMSQGR